MKETDVDKIVLSYLAKKGYKTTESSMKTEARVQNIDEMAFELGADEDVSVSNYILFYNANENNPRIYEESYRSLRTWVEDSLDMYRTELRTILFPVFVHCFLDLLSKNFSKEAREFMNSFKHDHLEHHLAELQRIESVDSLHLAENDLVTMFRNNKYIIRMCSYSFELLLSYLQDHHFMLLLRIINQYIHVQVFTGQPKQRMEDDSLGLAGVMAGQSLTQVHTLNQQTIFWGNIEPDYDNLERKKEADPARKAKMQEIAANTPPSDRIPRPKKRDEDDAIDAAALQELRQRVALGPAALPSICCYTYHNAQEGVCCSTISNDSSLMSAGFADSSIQIYNLKGKSFKTLKNGADLMNVNVPAGANINDYKIDTGKQNIKLVGHSGPVFGTSFSHDNRYLLSCSEDSTARLWSLDTHSNLVAYKGHNYPIWSCDFSPFSYYFATGSHDRTARLWSCDHIHPLRIFSGHLSDVDVVKFHPNANYVATGSSDRTVRLWDISKGSSVRIFTGHLAPVYALAFSPDGKHLVSAGEDNSIMLWDLGSGRRVKKLNGHRGVVYSLCFSPDGSVMASGSADSTVRIWDAKALTTAAANIKDDRSDEASRAIDSPELLATFRTKNTPIQLVQFTYRNILLCAGAYTGS